MALLPNDPAQQKKLLIGVLPVLVLVAYWFLFHGKRTDEIVALETRLEQLETRNAAARARAQQGGPELEQKLALYEQHITRLEDLVPRTEEVPQLLYDLTLRAREAGIELAKMTPSEKTPGPYYTLQTYNVAVLGSYHDVGRFLTAIGSLPRIVTPVGLSVQTRTERDRSGNQRLQADFRIETYVLPSEAQAATEEKPDART